MAAMGETLKKDQTRRRSAFIPRRWLAIGSLFIIAIAVGVLIANKLRGAPIESAASALTEAFRERRLIQPRLSGGFPGGEFQPSGAVSSIDDKFEQCRGLIMDAVASGEPGANLLYARLLLSKGEKLAEALKYLRLSLAREPESPEAHNDLGVCFIQQGKLEDAIGEFEEALKRKADMAEALFNRALCYEKLLLRDAANVEYGRLAETERDQTWMGEIQQRQATVSSPLVPQKLPQEIIASFESAVNEGDLGAAKRIAAQNLEFMLKPAGGEYSLAYLGDALAGNREGAERSLSKIELIGEQFAETKGDSTVSDLVRHFRSLGDNEWAEELRLLREYTRAEKLISEKRYVEAAGAFKLLGKLFANRGNRMMALSSTLYVATCLYNTEQLADSILILRRALASVEPTKVSYLRASLLCQLATACSRQGQDSSAVTYCQRAIERSSGLPWLQAKVRQFMGNTLWRLGDMENALASLRESTSLLFVSVPAPSELAYNYLQIADIYRIRGNHSLALLYARQAVTFLAQMDDVNRVAQTLAFMAVEHSRLGQFDQGETELQLAIDSVQKIDHGKRSYTESLVLTRGGEMAALRADLQRAEQFYSRAEALARGRKGNAFLVIKALVGRAEAYAQERKPEKAHADLKRAIRQIEGIRAGIVDRQNRGAFLDASQSVFDQMILLSIGAFGQKEEAFNYSEESRARVLLDEYSSAEAQQQEDHSPSQRRPRSQAKPLTLAKVRSALPADVRALAYSVTHERTYIFLVTRDGVDVVESPATTEILDRLVQHYVQGIKTQADLGDLQEQGQKLYEYLIKPIDGKINDGKTLCILPDKALHFLPFGALIDSTGRYLVNSHRLSYAPSASSLVRSLEEARTKTASVDESILSVGNPRFDKDEFPGLGDLSDAKREARESARFYKRYIVLEEGEATESRVRAELMNCDVAHLAVHCVVEEKSAWLATLILAQPGAAVSDSTRDANPVVAEARPSGDDGLLNLNEVYGMRLPRTRLVILSACESGLGQYYRGEGIVSLVRPFLAARVPTVVASLWSVDSAATAELMIRFHHERKTHHFGASDALQAAQIKMIESADYRHPFYWAAFVSVGAN